MDVSAIEWTLTVGITVLVILVDVIVVARRPHEPSTAECARYLAVYVGLAIAFGIWITTFHGSRYGTEFFAGWITEYSLSIDNLFIFIIIMASFNVPRKYQQEALMVGIVLALIFRAVFIALGAVAIEQISWVFYLFGVFLLYTGFSLVCDSDDDDDGENMVIRLTRKRFAISKEWDGLKLTVVENGKRAITPMLLVVISLGTTDLLFALDSIPAIYGLTDEPYLVFAANVFALMGLRQLYFLLGGLLKKLIYLSQGLALLLSFIGVKLILHALHDNELPFINGGERVPVPEISTLVSIAVIVGILSVTAIVSLTVSRRREKAGLNPDGTQPARTVPPDETP
ncbi:TerC/Alx family metal homeostasis membrane protein [Aeromicrobium sp. CF3.5]|uniref:TerC/Alx family metal homeostasis membrane protein n=1 Tax=Aeromicrobium sp. CF3.5 TaxID=3373078 RepID=UPI003EE7A43C